MECVFWYNLPANGAFLFQFLYRGSSISFALASSNFRAITWLETLMLSAVAWRVLITKNIFIKCNSSIPYGSVHQPSSRLLQLTYIPFSVIISWSKHCWLHILSCLGVGMWHGTIWLSLKINFFISSSKSRYIFSAALYLFMRDLRYEDSGDNDKVKAID